MCKEEEDVCKSHHSAEETEGLFSFTERNKRRVDWQEIMWLQLWIFHHVKKSRLFYAVPLGPLVPLQAHPYQLKRVLAAAAPIYIISTGKYTAKLKKLQCHRFLRT